MAFKQRAPRKILYVDDNYATRYAMCRFLRQADFETVEAADGAEALQQMATRPDLVILDVNLPDMTGFDVCRSIRSEPDVAHTPILMLSATYLDEQAKITGLNSGADGYLTHPVEPPVLIAYVKALLRVRQAENALRQLNAELEQRVAERTRALQASEARYRAIVEDQTELICRHLPDGTLSFVNGAASRYFGLTNDDLGTQNFLELITRDDNEQVQAALAGLGTEHALTTFEHRFVTADGQEHWLEWTNRAILDDDGRVCEYQAVGRDITTRKQAEERLRQALAREMEISEIRSRFISMASHDLRTPLAVIQSSSEVLARYADQLSAEERQKRYQRIRASIEAMTDMLNDILLIEQTESGQWRFQPQPVNLRELCDSVVEDFRMSVASKHTLAFETVGEYAQAVVDPRLVRNILQNLLSNAVKYSPDGSAIRLRLVCEAQQVRLSVEDEGIGIPTADQAHLFEAFSRAHNVGDIPGTGLGLTIVRQAVQLHRGKIALASEEGRGTTVTVTLPSLPPDQAG